MNPSQTGELFDIYESQYARDFEGRLIQIEKATQGDLQTILTVTIDGHEIKAPKATPATDDQGNLIRDPEGKLVPRLTTIFDAASTLFTTAPTEDDLIPRNQNPIPILCHQSHVKPVGVCRVCSVLTSRKGVAGARLVTACHHPLVAGMDVHTVASEKLVAFPGEEKPRLAGEHVRRMIKVLIELLAVNHLHHDQPGQDRKYHNELLELARRFDVPVSSSDSRLTTVSPFYAKSYDEGRTDQSSEVITLDHNQCILCDRCVRACGEVKPFKIIGHTGFGHKAKISFDLNQLMADSGCVSCGECAVACPTGALTFKGTIYDAGRKRDPWEDMKQNKPKTVTAEELGQIPLFSGVPYAYLKWNEGAVGRLTCQPGQILCREGEYGSTAFVIEQGKLDVVKAPREERVAVQTSVDILSGEMACMSHQARTATLRAQEGAVVLVVRRNMLHMLLRNRTARLVLYPTYRKRALATYLYQGQLFAGLTKEQNLRCVAYLQGLKTGVEFLQVDPGHLIFRQGNDADNFYIVNRGHVEVRGANRYGAELVLGYLEKGDHFGEIGLMSALYPAVAAGLPDSQKGKRTATCTALDHVELVSIGREPFQALLNQEPEIRDKLIEACLHMGRANRGTWGGVEHNHADFTAAGLFQGQNLLVIDLNKCTRCQECVKACADSHGGLTRLILEGNRFDQYLVPSACRSCHDPLCLVGCPVDAIHRKPAGELRGRGKSLAIVIENHCIGCGLCAYNCPFGSIHMADGQAQVTHATSERLATNCDLCESLDGRPRCVYHCPHDAAHRVDGHDFAVSLGLKAPASARPESAGA